MNTLTIARPNAQKADVCTGKSTTATTYDRDFIFAVNRGIRDADAGRLYTLEEIKNRVLKSLGR